MDCGKDLNKVKPLYCKYGDPPIYAPKDWCVSMGGSLFAVTVKKSALYLYVSPLQWLFCNPSTPPFISHPFSMSFLYTYPLHSCSHPPALKPLPDLFVVSPISMFAWHATSSTSEYWKAREWAFLERARSFMLLFFFFPKILSMPSFHRMCTPNGKLEERSGPLKPVIRLLGTWTRTSGSYSWVSLTIMEVLMPAISFWFFRGVS